MSAEEPTPEIGNWTSALATIRERMKEEVVAASEANMSAATPASKRTRQQLREWARALRPVSVGKLCEAVSLHGVPESVEALEDTVHQMIGRGEITASWIVSPGQSPARGIVSARQERERGLRAAAMAELKRSGETLEQIGRRYGITRERARQILEHYYPEVLKEYRNVGAAYYGPRPLCDRSQRLLDLAQKIFAAAGPVSVKEFCQLARTRGFTEPQSKLQADVYALIRHGTLPKERFVVKPYLTKNSRSSEAELETPAVAPVREVAPTPALAPAHPRSVEQIVRDEARERQPIGVHDLCDVVRPQCGLSTAAARIGLKALIYEMVKRGELPREHLILPGRGHPVHPKIVEKAAPGPRPSYKWRWLLDLAREHRPIGVLPLAQLARAHGSVMSEAALKYRIRKMLKGGQLPREWIDLPGKGNKVEPLEGLEVSAVEDVGNFPTSPPTDDAAVLRWLLGQSLKGELPAEIAQKILKGMKS